MDILLTSVGRRTYMVEYFKEALNHTGLVHAANSVETYAMKVADRSVVTPLIYNSSYIGFLLDYCLTNKVEAIIPSLISTCRSCPGIRMNLRPTALQ